MAVGGGRATWGVWCWGLERRPLMGGRGRGRGVAGFRNSQGATKERRVLGFWICAILHLCECALPDSWLASLVVFAIAVKLPGF